MTASRSDTAPQTADGAGVGRAAYTYFTDPEGLVFETAIPGERAGLDDFLAEEAAHEALTMSDLRSRIEQRGYSHYVLDRLRDGHLPATVAANLLGGHYHDFFRMAYSTAALQLPPDLLAALTGQAAGAIERARQQDGLIVAEIAYPSSMEDLSPLFAEVAYDPTRRHAPVMVVAHGDYPGSRSAAVPGLVELARAGFFALAVSKRGRDGSAGHGDAWCRETFDIVDALDHCGRELAAHLDLGNVAIIGQSAGGMDAAACVVRFPDTFRCAVDIAGTLDVASLVRAVGAEHRIENAGASAETYQQANRALYRLFCRDLGGAPDEVPDRVLARDLGGCGVNNPYTKTFFVWDEQDGGAALYEPGTRRYLADAARHGYCNSELLVSRVGDPIRYFHWIHPDQTILRHRFLPQLLGGTFPAPVLSPAGRLVVPGFVRTKRFTVWLGAGDDAVARLEYQLAGDGGTFRFRRLSSDPRARGRLTVHCANGTGRTVEFGLDETVEL